MIQFGLGYLFSVVLAYLIQRAIFKLHPESKSDVAIYFFFLFIPTANVLGSAVLWLIAKYKGRPEEMVKKIYRL